MQRELEIEWDILGAASHLSKSTTLLNRVVEWREDGIPWEPDPRQVERIVKDPGLVGGKHAVTPGILEHSKRRGQTYLPVDGVWVKSRDRIGDIEVRTGDLVDVRGHGPGKVLDVAVKGGQSRVKVQYEDRTALWCSGKQVAVRDERDLSRLFVHS